MTAPPETLSERDEIELLLPWYVTGRLDAADSARVEAALASDQTLRRQVELIQEDSRETVALNEAIAVPRTLSPAVLAARIAAEGRASPVGIARGLLGDIRQFFSAPTAGAVRFAAGVAAVVVVMQALAIGALVFGSGQPTYVTASGQSSAADTGTTVVVRFADNATARMIADGLRSLGIRIVDGPKPGGLFVVRIGDKSMPDADRERLTAALRANQLLFSFVSAQ